MQIFFAYQLMDLFTPVYEWKQEEPIETLALSLYLNI